MPISNSIETMMEAVNNWVSIMRDPYYDGFTGWAQKQKLYLLRKRIDDILSDPSLPTYHEEDTWIKENISNVN